MTALAVRSDPSQTLPAKIAYADALARSGLLPAAYRAKPANVLYAVEYGDMLGLPPMAAITGIHIIEGKPSASSGLISALVRRAGHKLRVTGNDKEATAHIVRADDPDFTFEARWTLERAKAADLAGKGTWKKYPAAMLKARAISEVARAACEEALFGLHYTPEELGAEVDEDGGVVGGVVVGEAAPVPAAAPAEDLWQTPAPESTDQEWLQAALEQAVTVTTKETGEKLWVEGAERQQDGRITPADAKRVADLLRARFAELKAGEAEVVDAETVEHLRHRFDGHSQRERRHRGSAAGRGWPGPASLSLRRGIRQLARTMSQRDDHRREGAGQQNAQNRESSGSELTDGGGVPLPRQVIPGSILPAHEGPTERRSPSDYRCRPQTGSHHLHPSSKTRAVRRQRIRGNRTAEPREAATPADQTGSHNGLQPGTSSKRLDRFVDQSNGYNIPIFNRT